MGTKGSQSFRLSWVELWLAYGSPERGLSMASSQWCFADFRLDPDNACLWRGTQPVALTPKAFDVLHYLVTHPDRLVTKDDPAGRRLA